MKPPMPPSNLDTTTKAAITALAAATGWDAANNFERARRLAGALVGKTEQTQLAPLHPAVRYGVAFVCAAVAADAIANDLKGARWVVGKVAKAAGGNEVEGSKPAIEA